MKKKLMFIIWALEVGGAERLFVKMVKRIPADKYDIRVVCMHRKGVWAEELEKSGVPVVSMNKKVGFDSKILWKLTSYIRKEKPDLVNTHLWTADLWGRLAAILAGVKNIIVTEQNVDVWKRWYHKIIDRVLFQKTDYVICVSNQVVEFYNRELKVPLGKIRMIPNAIDLTLFDTNKKNGNLRKELGLSEDDFIFVCAARLHPQKAHHVLIAAAEKMVKNGCTGFHILLVGQGELREELERLVRQKGLGDRVHFLGLRQDIPDILMQSDAFVLSSDYEGLPLAILEAMAARLPVVATRVGGNPMIVLDSESGFLVPSRNPDRLSNAMELLMKDRIESEVMGNAGRRLIEKEYSIQSIASRSIQLFEKCIGNRQPAQ